MATTGREMEDAARDTARDRGREAAPGIEAGVLPQDAARNRQQRMAPVAVVAGRVREAIARARHRLDRLGVERAVGIREVIDPCLEPVFQSLARADGLLEHPR